MLNKPIYLHFIQFRMPFSVFCTFCRVASRAAVASSPRIYTQIDSIYELQTKSNLWSLPEAFTIIFNNFVFVFGERSVLPYHTGAGMQRICIFVCEHFATLSDISNSDIVNVCLWGNK